MMRFKELRKRLNESDGRDNYTTLRPAVGPFNPDGAIDTPETNISSLTGESLEKINAYLGAAFCKSYINPSTVLNHIQMKLAEFGLHFDYRQPPAKIGVGPTKTTNSTDDKNGPIDQVPEGVHEFPLTMYGGSYGRYPTDPGFEPYHSDGITRKTGTPLVLCVNVMRNENSTFTVKPYIKIGTGMPAYEETEVDGEQIDEAKGEYLWKALPNGKWAVVMHQGGQKFKTVKIHDKKSDAISHVNDWWKKNKKESWGEEIEESKSQMNGYLDSLEDAYKKGGLKGMIRGVKGMDAISVYDFVDNMKDYFSSSTPEDKKYLSSEIKKILKPEDAAKMRKSVWMEAAKTYRDNPQIGKSRHSVSFHGGTKVNKDGSPFFDLRIFKSDKDKAAFIRGLEAAGYIKEEIEQIDEADWGGGFETSREAQARVNAGLKADAKQRQAMILAAMQKVVDGQMSKIAFKKLTGQSFTDMMTVPFYTKKLKMKKKESWGEETEQDEDITEAVSMKDMGFKPTTQIAGTSLVGYLKGMTINELTKVFGPPKKTGRGGKTTVIWAMTNNQLTITIYDYNTGGISNDQKYDFHVGSVYNKYSVKESVRRAFKMMGLKFTAKN